MKKKKVIMIVNTYFQLMTAINIKLTLFNFDNVDLIITDCSNNSIEIFNNLNRIKIFDNVYYFVTKSKIYSNKLKKIIYLFNKKYIWNIKKGKYDVLMFYNYDLFTFSIFDQLNDIDIYRFEEGFGSYLCNVKYKKYYYLNKIIDKILRKKNIEKNVKKYYFYHPELVIYNSGVQNERIPLLNRNNKIILSLMNEVFNYSKFKIKQKYIFFEESFFCDNKGIEDLDLILEIANIVGKENFVVKLHPRNSINRFKKYGILTLPSTNIPWELIQMNNDFSDKVLLTISSGSVLGSRLYFDDNIKTYLLYNCTDKMSDMVTDKYKEYLNKLKKNIGIDNFIIPNSKNEFLNLLRKENEIN